MTAIKISKGNSTDRQCKDIIILSSDEEEENASSNGQVVVEIDDDSNEAKSDIQILMRVVSFPASGKPWHQPCSRNSKDCVVTILSSDEEDSDIKCILPVKNKWRKDHALSKVLSKNKTRMRLPHSNKNSGVVFERSVDTKRSYLDVFSTASGEPDVKLIKLHHVEEKEEKSENLKPVNGFSSNIFDIMNTNLSSNNNTESKESFDEAKVANDLSHVMFLDDELLPIEEVVVTGDCEDDGIDDINHIVLTAVSTDSKAAQDSQWFSNDKLSNPQSATVVDSQWFPDDVSLETQSVVDGESQCVDDETANCQAAVTIKSQFLPHTKSLDRSSMEVVEAQYFTDDESCDSHCKVGGELEQCVDDESRNSHCKVDGGLEQFVDDESINGQPDFMQRLSADNSLDSGSVGTVESPCNDDDWQPVTKCCRIKVLKVPRVSQRNITASGPPDKSLLQSSEFEEGFVLCGGVQNTTPTVFEKSPESTAKYTCRCRCLSYLKSPPACHIQPRLQPFDKDLIQVYRENLTSLVETCIDEGDSYIPLAVTQIEEFTTSMTRPSFHHVCCLMGWLVRPSSKQLMKHTLAVLQHINELHGLPLRLQLWGYIESAYLVDLDSYHKLGPLIKSTVFNFVCCVLESELAHFDDSREKFTLSHIYRLASVDIAFGNIKTLVAWLEDNIILYLNGSTSELLEDRSYIYSLITSIQRMLGLCVEVSKGHHTSIQRLGSELLKAYSRLLVFQQRRLLLETLHSDAVIVFMCEQIILRIATPPQPLITVFEEEPCSMRKIVQFYFKFSPIVNPGSDPLPVVENFVYVLGLLQLTQLAKLKGKQQANENYLNENLTSSPVMSEEDKKVFRMYDERLTKLQNRLEQLYPEISKASSIGCHFLNLRLAVLMIN